MLYHIEESDEYEHRVWVVGLISWHAPFPDAPRGDPKYSTSVVEYIRKNRIMHCGRCHQNLPEGALRFSDGLMFATKQSHWAIEMSDAWDNEPGCGSHFLYSCEHCSPAQVKTPDPSAHGST